MPDVSLWTVGHCHVRLPFRRSGEDIPLYYDNPIFCSGARAREQGRGRLHCCLYGQGVYDKWCDDSNKCHGGQAPVKKAPKQRTLPAFTHRPDHDGESIFWTLLHSFVKALPLNGRPELSFSMKLSSLMNMMFDHRIEGSVAIEEDPDDTRDDILHWSDDQFDRLLHPDLRKRGIGPLLEKMAVQVQPEYARLEPKPRVEHLHEAFRRLLLEFIIEFKNDTRGDIQLDPKQRRNLWRRLLCVSQMP